MAKQSEIDAIIGPQPKRIWLLLSTLGLLTIVAATLIPVITVASGSLRGSYFDMNPTFKFIYAAGALLLFVCRLFSPYKGNELRVKRLSRIETWSAIFFCVGAFFLFYDTDTTRNWLAFTLAGGAIQCYASLMIPRAVNKAIKALDKNPER